jgi:hypothetical protein
VLTLDFRRKNRGAFEKSHAGPEADLIRCIGTQ